MGLLLLGAMLLFAGDPAAAQRGPADALAAAEKLLDSVGGRTVWARRLLVVHERGYLRSGETIELRIERDLEANTRHTRGRTPTRELVEWISPQGAWTARNGEATEQTIVERAVNLQGLRQEPYSIYHRLARRDPALRFELRDAGRTLHVFDLDERPLCWFELDAAGRLTSWGNHWNGSAVQHRYGPTVPRGPVQLPAFGAAQDGSFRFEYLDAQMEDRALIEPLRPSPR
jgi:hypothetical protein